MNVFQTFTDLLPTREVFQLPGDGIYFFSHSFSSQSSVIRTSKMVYRIGLIRLDIL